jgi:hypothetical protein
MRMTTNEFRTDLLALSAYLHSTARLRFLRAEHIGNGKGEFVFADPEHEAESIRRAFEARNCFVEPLTYHKSLRALRATLGASTNEDEKSYERNP